jgi:hypothetical protein
VKNDYARRKRAAEARVVRWEWASAPDRSPVPFWFEREKKPRGRRIPAPRRPRDQVAYGLDAGGQVAVEREGPYETFHAEGEWIRFHHGAVDTVGRTRHRGGKIVELAQEGPWGGFVERYRWKGGRIVRIDRRAEAWTDWFEITWDGDEVAEILGWDPFRKRASIVYARPREPAAKLAAAVEKRLARLIPRAVPKQPLFSLVLAYDGEGHEPLPPALGVGLDSERPGRDPASYRNYPILFADEKLAILCRKLNQQLGIGEGAALLERVCAALRKKSWKRASGFLVYAVDFGLRELPRALRRARTGAASRRRRSSRP